MSTENMKGEYGGECNQRECTSVNAEWFHHGTKRFYCGKCAENINELTKDDVRESFHISHALLTKDPDWKTLPVQPGVFKHPDVTLVEGDLLDAGSDFMVVHQCNCTSTKVSGVAKALFDKYPYANSYSEKRVYGTHQLRKDPSDPYLGVKIVNMYTQLTPGGPITDRDAEERLHLFVSNLTQIFSYYYVNGLKIALPYLVGCGLGGGDWNQYWKAINQAALLSREKAPLPKKPFFPADERKIYVVKLPQQPIMDLIV
jgi:hypothetical protein